MSPQALTDSCVKRITCFCFMQHEQKSNKDMRHAVFLINDSLLVGASKEQKDASSPARHEVSQTRAGGGLS